MRPLSDLVVEDDSAWPEIEACVGRATLPVEVLAVDRHRGDECLEWVQVTTRSWLGSVVYHTGGILVDGGWLRVFGSGHRGRSLLDIRAANEGDVFGLVIGQDVLGGIFTWGIASGASTPTVHYFAPDSLRWEDLDCGYGAWLNGMLEGGIVGFYESLRWPGWEAEVGSCRLDYGIHTLPPAWTSEGKDLSRVSRKSVPMMEILSLNFEFARKLDGGSD